MINETTETYVDRSKWMTQENGPWLDEPDKISWTDEETGMACLIVRGGSGALCGYVAVEPSHKLYGMSYSDLWRTVEIEVHGGLTYADKCQVGGKVCHVPEPGKPDDVWWFGFDCAHSGDICPSYNPGHHEFYASYRSVNYVKFEVESLARQLFSAQPT